MRIAAHVDHEASARGSGRGSTGQYPQIINMACNERYGQCFGNAAEGVGASLSGELFTHG